ncbi:dihydroflavonol 4-reductase [Longibacter salinarum]|uniref:Dihydroflavonol 4-reductase n=1 Tax=Longibacter salinarum TaxID=1850348 RepID=A0A2A8CY23_9BACT|nr:NAD-dependent epimerase/dehydratase family protein [Longibacter salinarum]PEN13595.1 dihydroflavonol 4-reductase [Longibacter salinarum]
MTEPRRTLVTGATGLVGSELVHQLLANGQEVRIFRRSSSDLSILGDAADEVEHAMGDIRDARSLLDAMQDVTHVYHAAAQISFGPGQQKTLHEVNVYGTGNVVNAALRSGVQRLVHTSSMAAFGRPAGPMVINESTSWDDEEDRSAYARSKYESELEVHRGIAEGLDAVIVNPSLIFGVGREGHGTRRIIDAVRSGWARAVPPGGSNVVDVQDVVQGMRNAMARGEKGRRYFLGSQNLSWHEIVGTLAEAFGQPPPSRTIPPSLMSVAAVASEVVSFVTRTRPMLTREHVQTSTATHEYENRRARTELGCSFQPFEVTARRIAAELSALSRTEEMQD